MNNNERIQSSLDTTASTFPLPVAVHVALESLTTRQTNGRRSIWQRYPGIH